MIFLAPRRWKLSAGCAAGIPETAGVTEAAVGKADGDEPDPGVHYIVINDVIERAARDLGGIITANGRARRGVTGSRAAGPGILMDSLAGKE